MWTAEGTDEFAAWYNALTPEQQDALAGRIELLEERGPDLKRPPVGEIKGSRHAPHMKELRVSKGGDLRVLFPFDPRRTAILLLGGDKTGQCETWYRSAIPEADRLYDRYLDELRAEGWLDAPARRDGSMRPREEIDNGWTRLLEGDSWRRRP